jgi:hypothetical protein
MRVASLEEMLGEDSPLTTQHAGDTNTRTTGGQHDDSSNALDGKALHKTATTGYGASANVPQVQKCTKVASEPI